MRSGGEELILEVAGQDATEAFLDVGHSDEAREILHKLIVGTLKRKAPAAASSSSKADSTSFKTGLYAAVLVGGLAAYFGYQYIQANNGSA
ncbi:hypothetical protein FGADI_13586 [Fusarium gaditjirri]|uniref:Cytochrome b5 heme-binding domain-containing protein n=1 Tax=Fusarium gaditjirri TaxID=282569 RepID=A0A8H4SPG5_9HYPO|nr:hypothetical protein FGADI_13586 [Fusarium gaditjirri]